MNLLIRLFRVLFCSLCRSRMDPLDVSVVNFRVWPNDLDINGHMNNGRYLTIMDLGRLDFVFRAGLGKYIMRRSWMPLVASAKIRFRRSLSPFQKYQLHTRLLCWDDKWFIIEQHFMVNDRAVAVAHVKGLFRSRRGNVPPSDVLLKVGHTLESPPIPEFIRLWMDAEEAHVID
ncbi:MAG: thioesterase family protein [Gammaproteobacteria bacterium]|nr:thioesterase family protein [Gammaproteobacteria bacterium]